MQRKRKQQLKREAKKFSLTGIAATLIDYAIFNVMTLLLHLSPIPANVISTTISSVASYKMNAKLVFEGRRHSRKTTIVLYILITAFGIYVIQNISIYLIHGLVDTLFRNMPQVISLNISKIVASLIAGIWNYLMLRYFVFIPESKKEEIEAAD